MTPSSPKPSSDSPHNAERELTARRFEQEAMNAYYHRDAEALRRLIHKLLAMVSETPKDSP